MMRAVTLFAIRASFAALALFAPVSASVAQTPAAPAVVPAPVVTLETLTAGTGAKPTREDFVLIAYKGMLKDGTVFDSSQGVPMAVADVVPGFADGLVQMQRGGSYRLRIPAALGYGDSGSGPIPPNSDLVFEVTLLDFKTRAELEALMAAQQPEQAPQPTPQESGQPR